MPHRALITGLTGFVGGFLADHLLQLGDEVWGVSPDGRWLDSSPQEIRARVRLLAWDVGDAAPLRAELRQALVDFAPQWIFHLAALSVPEDCGRDAPTPLTMAVNVEGTRRVLDLAAALPSRPRVLLASSSHVYAPVPAEAAFLSESAPLGPTRAYGQTKLAAEAEVQRAVAAGRCDAVIARSFAHTGPRQTPRMMLPQWAQQFAAGSGPVQIHSRDVTLDLTDVRDVVRAYRLLLLRGRTGAVYNVGTGAPRLSGQILDILRGLADPQHKRVITELRPGVRFDPLADIARIVAETGWRPEIPLEQTVADTWTWWRDQVR